MIRITGMYERTASEHVDEMIPQAIAEERWEEITDEETAIKVMYEHYKDWPKNNTEDEYLSAYFQEIVDELKRRNDEQRDSK